MNHFGDIEKESNFVKVSTFKIHFTSLHNSCIYEKLVSSDIYRLFVALANFCNFSSIIYLKPSVSLYRPIAIMTENKTYSSNCCQELDI
jgi:hypothetical protein